MNKENQNGLILFPLLILIGLGIAIAGSQSGTQVYGIPLFGLCVAFAFAIQWLVFIPSFLFQTEKFFDLTGSITYISVTLLAAFMGSVFNGRSILLFILVIIWAIRLGSYLFYRIHQVGKDDRFDQIKPSFIRFLNTWTLQGLWVTFTLSAALAAMTTSIRKELGLLSIIGLVFWIAGFGIEVIADLQKSRFRAKPENRDTFIQTGLWSRSRHPNYFGEIILWIGVAVIALPAIQGWQMLTLISPVFVILLLTQVSGIPMLEKKADKKWGGRADYEKYKMETPVLIPRI